MLRGIALNRVPGLHFPGNFLDVCFERVARDASRLSIAPGPWCAEADGQTDFGSMAILADLALAACIRANLGRETRLATVAMYLQITGAPRTGRLSAASRFEGFFRHGAGKLGMSSVSVAGGQGQVCYGTGSFMALPAPERVALHPVPYRNRKSPEPRRLREEDLDPEERKILARADAALGAPGAFIRSFWGSSTRLENGLHIGNRVGHAQGGILLGMAAATAAAALPAHWALSGISAWYTSPGAGPTLHANSRLLHHGRLTAVVRTRITSGRRRVLEVVTTHCAAY